MNESRPRRSRSRRAIEQHERIDRRQLLRRAAAFGLSAPAVAALLSACGTGGHRSTSTPAPSTVTPLPGQGTPVDVGWRPRDVSVKLTGSGSSFVDPAMQLWIQRYKELAPHVTINYQSVGSGQGKRDFISEVTDFAGTDAYMTDDEMKRAPGTLHFPVVLGAVAITFNLSGVDKLQLAGPTLADIYLGRIKKWNDAKIAADNPGVNLPSTGIAVTYRADGSGTTAIFTNFLSKVSEDWKKKVGFGTAVQWPTGIGGQQSPGVAAAVQQTPGAIGYYELTYAIENKAPVAAIKNESGTYVVPSLDGASADAAGFVDNLPDDLRIFITDAPQGLHAYPITGFSWMLLRPSYDDTNKARALTDFCYFCITQGQQISKSLQYAPLPDAVTRIETRRLETIQSGGQSVFAAPVSQAPAPVSLEMGTTNGKGRWDSMRAS